VITLKKPINEHGSSVTPYVTRTPETVDTLTKAISQDTEETNEICGED
jgi:hypothetical protein